MPSSRSRTFKETTENRQHWGEPTDVRWGLVNCATASRCCRRQKTVVVRRRLSSRPRKLLPRRRRRPTVAVSGCRSPPAFKWQVDDAIRTTSSSTSSSISRSITGRRRIRPRCTAAASTTRRERSSTSAAALRDVRRWRFSRRHTAADYIRPPRPPRRLQPRRHSSPLSRLPQPVSFSTTPRCLSAPVGVVRRARPVRGSSSPLTRRRWHDVTVTGINTCWSPSSRRRHTVASADRQPLDLPAETLLPAGATPPPNRRRQSAASTCSSDHPPSCFWGRSYLTHVSSSRHFCYLPFETL